MASSSDLSPAPKIALFSSREYDESSFKQALM